MYLKSLEVQGFKSFPDKTLIRFGDAITAIVGPNGSGKSNISDAICWVMGEQSTKALRGGKMEDVIFGGTQKRSAVGFAEATLILDNSDRALAYDADEVMVTRRYYRSGDSEYYINLQSARLRDINELFMDTGLGKEGYSNISQGRIDEILSLKSTDRREIFEEAAGISKYRHRKEEAQRKLAATEDNLLRIGDKIAELEIQLEPLRVQSEKAKKYLQYKEELRGQEVSVWLEQLRRLSAASQKAQEDYASASFVLQQEHETLNRLYARAEELAQSLRDQDLALETLRTQGAAMEAANKQQEGKLAVMESSGENNRANAQRIARELDQQADRSGGIAQQIQQGLERIRDLDVQIEDLDQKIRQQETALAVISANAQGMTRQFLELRETESSLVAELAGLRADLSGLETAADQAITRLEELQALSDQQLALQKEYEENLANCRRALAEAAQQVSIQNNTIAGYAMRLDGRRQRQEALQEEIRKLAGQMEGIGARARVFAAMERDYENYSKSVKSVMQESGRGALKNIHGPVSRLIRTEDDYTVAIEVALGAAMQQIVVDTEQDAKAAIGFLKRTGAGRATFLPISTITPRTLQERGLEGCKGFVGVASQLVECQQTYRAIVENLLGRTVIVETLDHAIAMSRQYSNRFRIVTLDGQVMNQGGSMTGGSMNKDSGILSRANELERLQTQLARLQAKRQTLEQQLQEVNRTVAKGEFELSGAQELLRQAEDAVLRLQGDEKQLLALLQAAADALSGFCRESDALESRASTDEKRKAALETKIALQSGALEKTRWNLASLEQDQSDIARQSDGIMEELTALKTRRAGAQAEQRTARDHVENLESLQRDMQGDRSQKERLLADLEAEYEKLLAQVAELRQQMARDALLLEQHHGKLQQAQARRTSTEAEKTMAERDAQEKSKDILTMERACALLEQKKITSAMEENQIVDKLWDNYGLTPGTAAQEQRQIESVSAANRTIAELKKKLSALGNPNLGAIDEYARVNERYSYLAEQRDDVLTSKRELESIIRDIVSEMTAIFTGEFRKIDLYFGQTFVEMFGGGKASLVLEDPDQPLSCGIEIRVQPPGKQLKTITLLSGGEKAFVAIALYFAILKVRPTPFCMLDEIDAALDDRNVERFASYLRNLCEKTQFIVITHRRGTMEAADILYGVTMQEQGVSKILHLDLNQMEQNLGIIE